MPKKGFRLFPRTKKKEQRCPVYRLHHRRWKADAPKMTLP